jgi:hypothetical protein
MEHQRGVHGVTARDGSPGWLQNGPPQQPAHWHPPAVLLHGPLVCRPQLTFWLHSGPSKHGMHRHWLFSHLHHRAARVHAGVRRRTRLRDRSPLTRTSWDHSPRAANTTRTRHAMRETATGREHALQLTMEQSAPVKHVSVHVHSPVLQSHSPFPEHGAFQVVVGHEKPWVSSQTCE